MKNICDERPTKKSPPNHFRIFSDSILGADCDIPSPLITLKGEQVDSPEKWKERRSEILELFRENVYGRPPSRRPGEIQFKVIHLATDALDGNATLKQVRISYTGPGGNGAINLILYVPNTPTKPVPCFLFICNRNSENIDPARVMKTPFWPVEQIVARGYAAAAFYNSDVASDQVDGFSSGVFQVFSPNAERQSNSWGAIAAWSWGASLAMDYLETDSSIDSRRVAVVGHSRCGKAAMWAGAEDPRFAMVVSNNSGCTGAAMARGKAGERIRDINEKFPHWFCQNYNQFNDSEQKLPLDQHMLVSLIAPRFLYISSASEDKWADPKSEFRSAILANPVYQLFKVVGLAKTEMPKTEVPLHHGNIGYHLRTGKHDLTEYDWNQFMDFADIHLPSVR